MCVLSSVKSRDDNGELLPGRGRVKAFCWLEALRDKIDNYKEVNILKNKKECIF